MAIGRPEHWLRKRRAKHASSRRDPDRLLSGRQTAPFYAGRYGRQARTFNRSRVSSAGAGKAASHQIELAEPGSHLVPTGERQAHRCFLGTIERFGPASPNLSTFDAL